MTLVRTIAISVLACAASGCSYPGPPRADVTGNVTLDGKPLEQGGITFVPIGDTTGPAVVDAISAGAYRMRERAIIGKNRVEIRSRSTTGRKVASQFEDKVTVDETVQILPGRYNDKSELIADVQPGSNNFDFNLKSK